MTARPRLRGAAHAAGALAAVPAGAVLVAQAATTLGRTAMVVFSAGLVAVLAISATYHRGPWDAGWRRWWKAADHVGIFAFMATSWTPLGVLELSPPAAWAFVGSLCSVCLAGSLVKLRKLDHANRPADAAYAVAAWWGLLVAPALVHRLGTAELALLLIGLLLYSATSVIMITRRPDPVPAVFGFHEVAHLVGLVGIACHWLLYYRLVSGGRG